MDLPLARIARTPLDVDQLVAAVCRDADRRAGAPGRAGAVATFIGYVRVENLGRRVVRLEYEAYDALAIKAFGRITSEAAGRWPDVVLGIHHRVGPVGIGEASVAIAAAAPHRAEAFAACRYAIERVKQIAPVWKHEHFEGGDAWIEGATADPEDPAAIAEAVRRSCA